MPNIEKTCNIASENTKNTKKKGKALDTLPCEFFKKLPYPLNSYSQLKRGYRRDAAFLSSLAALSSVLPNLFGELGGDMYSPHILLGLGGPSAAGKGMMMKAAGFLFNINEGIKEKSDTEYEEYRKAHRAWKDDGEDGEEPQEPQKKRLVAADGVTGAALTRFLKANEDRGGVMISSELESLCNSMRSEYGAGISVILRKCFSHEVINTETIERGGTMIKQPRLACLLSGTLSQIQSLATPQNSENGLVSRFLFYRLQVQGAAGYLEEVNPAVPNGATMALVFKEIYGILDGHSAEVFWHFGCSEDFQKFKEIVSPYYDNSLKKTGENRAEVIRRGVNLFRILGILAVLRVSFDEGGRVVGTLGHTTAIKIGSQDIENMAHLARVLHFHSGYFCGENTVKIKHTKETILAEMGDIFTYQDFCKKAAEAGKVDRTARRWLAGLIDSGDVIKIQQRNESGIKMAYQRGLVSLLIGWEPCPQQLLKI